MKQKLLFIDNDREELGMEDVRRVQRKLDNLELPTKNIEDIELIFDFGKKLNDKMMKKLFSGKYIICTWSVYTYSHFNSLGQIISLLKTAARSEVKGIIYIDATGEFKRSVGKEFDRIKDPQLFLSGVQRNYILTFEEEKLVRLLPDFYEPYGDIFKSEAIDILKIIS